MIKLKHFIPEEFMSQGKIVIDKMDEAILLLIDQLRTNIDKPIYITSSFRSPEYNRIVGGSSKSQHLVGKAIDIKCPDDRYRYLVIKEAFALGFSGIGIGSNFIHLDIRKTHPAMWTY